MTVALSSAEPAVTPLALRVAAVGGTTTVSVATALVTEPALLVTTTE